MSRPERSLRANPLVNVGELSFAEAFENAPHAMALVSERGTLLYVNRALCAMLGFDRDELLRQNIGAITHPDDLETELEQRQRLARSDIGRYELMQRLMRKNAEPVWVRLSVSATRRGAHHLAYLVVQAEAVAPPSCDVTERDSYLQRFGDATLSAMHEIGNTLTPLMVNAELIVEQSRNQPVSDFAHEIFKAARRIAFTLRRLRRIDECQPVAYVGADRMLDLRLIPPRVSTDGENSAEARESLDSEE